MMPLAGKRVQRAIAWTSRPKSVVRSDSTRAFVGDFTLPSLLAGLGAGSVADDGIQIPLALATDREDEPPESQRPTRALFKMGVIKGVEKRRGVCGSR